MANECPRGLTDNPEDSRFCMECVLDLDPKHADSYYNLGLCQEEIELEHLALENFKKFLNLDSDKTSECVVYAKRAVNKYIK